MAAEATTSLSLANEKTERIRGAVVSGNYFPVLGVALAAGCLIAPEDDRVPGGHPVAIISHGLWQRSYALDPAIIGKIIRLNAMISRSWGLSRQTFAVWLWRRRLTFGCQ